MKDKDSWEALWESSKENPKKSGISKSEVWNNLKKEIEKKKTRKRIISKTIYATAACVVLFFGVLWFWKPFAKENIIHIAKQDTVSVKLKDGTLVKLFPGAKIEINSDFAINNRKLTLEGDAFFD
ncbi:MAG: hypothetical protein Q4G16_13095, partial [Cruoricaptor ignavus]|nr:hypothetical protein [Cruoricaptor ignavus]